MEVPFKIKISVLVSLVFSFVPCVTAGFAGYSYAKFRGPVSGPEHEVKVEHSYGHGIDHHDYTAKPDYHFAYGVEDPKTMVKQSRHETRYGDEVKGEYSVLDPDGKYRTVKYTADKHNGFQAEIITDGKHDHYPMGPVHDTPQVHIHEVHHYTPHDQHHYTPHDEHHYIPHEVHHIPPTHDHDVHQIVPQPHGHEVHHHEEDRNTYNEEESTESGYDETDDTSDSSGEDGDDGSEYY